MLLKYTLLAVPVSALWPTPVHITSGNKTLFVDQSLKVHYNGIEIPHGEFTPPAGPQIHNKDIVHGAISRALTTIFDQSFVPWMLRDPASDYEPHIKCNVSKHRIRDLVISHDASDAKSTFKPTNVPEDESYSLNVTADGHATLHAASTYGVLHGLQTFSQLFWKHSASSLWYTQQAPLQIRDEPKYPHRGVHMDVSRHWFDVSDIKRTIDGLSMTKLNVLHLHITDTQSWPLEIPALPRLAEKGAHAKGLTYSPAAIANLYEYAIHRGVQIIMEIDMPGHMGVEKAYPGLSVAYNQRPYGWYCAQPPCGSLRLGNKDVENFIDTLFGDLLPRIAPYTAYFHTGGDEYKANNSILDPALKTNDTKILQPLLQRFLNHAHGGVRKHGLTPMVWEEMLLQWNATLGKDVVIQSWLGEGAVKKLAEAGHKVVDSTVDFYYLDCGRGEFIDYENGEQYQNAYPFNDWCSPTKNWRVIYSHNPRQGLTGEAAKNVLGGELPVWAETIDTTNLDSIVWPRAAAAGESWWSGSMDHSGKNRSMLDARVRLAEMRERMLARGVRGAPITQLWCDQTNPEDCSAI